MVKARQYLNASSSFNITFLVIEYLNPILSKSHHSSVGAFSIAGAYSVMRIHEGHNYEQFQHRICVWQRYYALSKQDLSEYSTHPESEAFCFSRALQSADCSLFPEIPTWTEMSHSHEATPEPPLPPTPASSHRGTLLLSHETRKAACSNPYLIQPFHIWIIRQEPISQDTRAHYP